MRIVFKSGLLYYAKGTLPLTGKEVHIGTVTNRESFDNMSQVYLKYFSKISLYEFKRFTKVGEKHTRLITSRGAKSNIIKRVYIPRVKKTRMAKLVGNMLVKSDDKYAYIQVSHFKKRRIIKIDLEDYPKVYAKVKSNGYLIARYFKTEDTVQYIHCKKRKRQNSLYSYILGRPVFEKITHIDGDIFNYSKENISLDFYKKCSRYCKPSDANGFIEKPVEELVGIRRYSDVKSKNYTAKIWVRGKEIRIGRFVHATDAAKAYDIARMYYIGAQYTKNYSYDYYMNFEKELVDYWFEKFSKKKPIPDLD